jgi:hypothetical protein
MSAILYSESCRMGLIEQPMQHRLSRMAGLHR